MTPRTNGSRTDRRRRAITLAALGAFALLALLAQCGTSAGSAGDAGRTQRGVDAFATVYAVLQHPRCRNCHPAGPAPLQGDDGRVHGQNVTGGPAGRGRFALRCASCHLAQNGAGPNLPPGAPDWHMPPAATPMVFVGRSPAELARQLVDPEQNGGMTRERLLRHVTDDALVLWGWSPGDGRAPVDVPHEQFVGAMRTWIDCGCPVPP